MISIVWILLKHIFNWFDLPLSWKRWKTFREIMGQQKFNCDFKKTLDPLCDSSLCANQSSLLLLHVVSEFSKASFLSCSLSKLPYTFDLLEIRTGPTNQRTLCFHLTRDCQGITCKIFHLKIVVVLP